ncbi:multisubunit Na+/H+ antiporter MnhF subunit [Arcanobacterium pluranimalium]|uniref:monovalent cation/H+ antiporter complex subunit F n=1 Tax=Arcanobacterium pluranimalium TaxID=108028 RepID=UPI00195B9E56|nr:cation:proton antiporter [Arcanobacterium pluranimalium]MBM7824289.1 multisubunit Na+/H+ antiporter MnhF subunit [Arcanobacterium pluranimalium]
MYAIYEMYEKRMDEIMVNLVLGVCAGMLVVSAVFVLVRVAKGPTTLDRMVAVDMMTAIFVGACALLAAHTRRLDLLPVFIVLSIVGFLGSTTLARFSVRGNNRRRPGELGERKTRHEQTEQSLGADGSASSNESWEIGSQETRKMSEGE